MTKQCVAQHINQATNTVVPLMIFHHFFLQFFLYLLKFLMRITTKMHNKYVNGSKNTVILISYGTLSKLIHLLFLRSAPNASFSSVNFTFSTTLFTISDLQHKAHTKGDVEDNNQMTAAGIFGTTYVCSIEWTF